MKVLIAGGHLTPALAVIEQLPKGTEVLYVGRTYALEGDSAYSLEYNTITQRHIAFANLNAGRLQRKFTKHTIAALFKLPKGFFEAKKIIAEFQPDIIVGFGGYVSVPLGIVGAMRKIPVIIHEQTLGAGLANKILAPFASKICVSWKSSLQHFPKRKTVITGNPAMEAIFHTQSHRIERKLKNLPLLVIVGGSLGSHAINVLVEDALSSLLSVCAIIHQTGGASEFGDFDRLSEKKYTLPLRIRDRYEVTKFIDPKDIIATLNSADVVVTRAGINTLTTLLILNKPSLVIPLPSSQKNDQQRNADFFAAHGLGKVLNQDLLNPESLSQEIFAMIKHRDEYKNTRSSEELIIHQYAGKKIVDIITFFSKKEVF